MMKEGEEKDLIREEHIKILASIRELLYGILGQLRAAAQGDVRLTAEIASLEKKGVFKNIHRFCILMLKLMPLEQAATGVELVKSMTAIKKSMENSECEQGISQKEMAILKEFLDSSAKVDIN